MSLTAAVTAIAGAMRALADLFAKFILIKRENHAREINLQARGFRKIRASVNARNEARQTMDKNFSAGDSNSDDVMPDDGFRRD